MEIIALGHSCFKLKGKTASVITDPFDEAMLGIKIPKNTSADIVTISHHHKDHDNEKIIVPASDRVIVLKGPGEYEIKGVEVTGISSTHDTSEEKNLGSNTIYKIEIDGISLAHLGDLGDTLSDAQLDALDGVDVLFVPVGGKYTVDAEKAVDVVNQIEPQIVIPMHYNRPALNQENFGKLLPVNLFLKEIGQENITPLPKIKVTKDLLPKELQVIILE